MGFEVISQFYNALKTLVELEQFTDLFVKCYLFDREYTRNTRSPAIFVNPVSHDYAPPRKMGTRPDGVGGTERVLTTKTQSLEIRLWGRTIDETELLESLVFTRMRELSDVNFVWGNSVWLTPTEFSNSGYVLILNCSIVSTLPVYQSPYLTTIVETVDVNLTDTPGDGVLGKV
jgi:hypothetical protein